MMPPAPTPSPSRVAVGDRFPTLALTGLHDETVRVPDPAAALTHLQFRRFAGCPVCTLHLRSIRGRLDDITAADIAEVVVFHSTAAELRTYQDEIPFSVVADPTKTLYRRFGVRSSPKAILTPGAWRALPRGWSNALKTALATRRAPLPARPTNGNLGLPADLLIAADGRSDRDTAHPRSH